MLIKCVSVFPPELRVQELQVTCSGSLEPAAASLMVLNLIQITSDEYMVQESGVGFSIWFYFMGGDVLKTNTLTLCSPV